MLFSRKCTAAGLLTEAEVSGLDNEVKKEIEEATRFAIDSPYPKPEALYEDLYV